MILLPDLLAGIVWVVVALVTLRRRGSLPSLAALIGIAWLIVEFAPVAVFWHRALLALLLLASPGWWPRSWTARSALLAQFAAALLVFPWTEPIGALALTTALITGFAVEARRARFGPLRWTAAALTSVTFALPALLPPDRAWSLVVSWGYASLMIAVALLVAADARQRSTAPLDRLIELGASGDLAASPHDVALAEELRASHDVLAARIHVGLSELRASTRRLTEASLSAAADLSDDLHAQVRAPLQELLRLPTPPGPAEASFEEARRHLGDADGDIASILVGLGPRSLCDGLEPSLRSLAGASPIPTTLDVRAGILPDPVARTAYLVCAEALTNVAKHARASTVHVEAVATPGGLALSIRDDGGGGAEPQRGTGLVGMRDRVEALGGEFAIESGPGGTVVGVRLPLTPTEDSAAETARDGMAESARAR